MKKTDKNPLNKSPMKRFRLILTAILFISVAALFLPNLVNRTLAAPDSSLFFSPATRTVNLGDNFSLAAKINPGSNQVTAVELHVTFDQTKFRLDSITSSTDFPVIFDNSINNTNGTATMIVGIAAANPYVPVTTEVTVATFTFHALALVNGSAINITNSSVAAAVGESGDVVNERLPATVTVSTRTYNNTDFANLVADWLQTGSSPADVNSDNVVNTRDLGIMMNSWLP
jgi:hypothetical protein